MAAAVCFRPSSIPILVQHDAQIYPPINFFYSHFHNSIRSELDFLSQWVLSLEPATDKDLLNRLFHLKDRYQFLAQVYKYHSSVEDEVVYPALEVKVKNVTNIYSVEHQDEELLFEQLAQLLNTALCQGAPQRRITVRSLVCKVEEIHTTLRKHLAKEEEQLQPLLLHHFSFAEQAELVAQFLYCIPLATVERVLSWLKPSVPKAEQEHLLIHIRQVISDDLLLQLLVTWLDPQTTPPLPREAPPSPQLTEFSLPSCDSCSCSPSTRGEAPRPARPPLTAISHIHHSIKSALDNLAQEAQALQQAGDVSPSQLAALGERHRFLRSVCMFHTMSEEEVMFPEVARIKGAEGAAGGAAGSSMGDAVGGPAGGVKEEQECQTFMDEHHEELALFEELGRLLSDVKAYARRGRKEVGDMVAQLSRTARDVVHAVTQHMHKEESEVLPLLQQHLCHTQQRAIVWRTLRAMPLRLLERVMPWLMDKLSLADATEMLRNIELGAPPEDTSLVQLVSRWADRGRAQQLSSPPRSATSSPGLDPAQAKGYDTTSAMEQTASTSAATPPPASTPSDPPTEEDTNRLYTNDTCRLRFITTLPPDADHLPPFKRQRTTTCSSCDDDYTSPSASHPLSLALPGTHPSPPHPSPRQLLPHKRIPPSHPGYNPIDHIFQFHKALRTELKHLEEDAAALETAVLMALPTSPPAHKARHTDLRPELNHSEDDAASLEQAVLMVQLTSPPAPSPSPPPTSTSRANSATLPSSSNPNISATCLGAAPSIAPLCAPQLSAFATAHTQQPTMPTGHQHPTPSTSTIASSQTHMSIGQTGQPSQTHNQPSQTSQAHTSFSTQWLTSAGSGLPSKTGAGGSVEEEGSSSMWRAVLTPVIQQMDGRFQFLWGIYRAHSRAEDEIVFPALESKEALLNISHAYTLDHQAEEQLFHDVDMVLQRIRSSSSSLREIRDATLQLRRMCAAVRASLETHVRAEERELWPLFAEHFSIEEQQRLVGVIIGRTGAEVLQALLPWVTAPFSEEERDAMMESLREATKNTKFDAWLDAIHSNTIDPTTAPARSPLSTASGSSDDLRPLEEVAEYLRGGSVEPLKDNQEPSGTVAESSTFRPGWEDIFRMNQKQLEAAIRRVSNDPNLDPNRKAYLLQHLMVSRYIVSQQKRMDGGGGCAASAAAAAAAGGRAAVAAAAAEAAAPLRTYSDSQQQVLGCQHYRRKCKLVAPCCNQPFTCRLCHDDCSNHKMDRYAVQDMVCMVCGTRQPVASHCGTCSTQMAAYFCSICNLFDDEPGRDIYHCPFCNVCRRGKGLGKDFFHCMKCNACMSMSLQNHNCRENCMEGNCPVCHEYLFDSSQPIKELPCGHFLHSSCFASYTRYNYTCPICSKSIGDMSVYFQMLDYLLAREHLPPEYKGRTQPVLCHDCGKQGASPFHFAYHKCGHCQSYNTRVL